MLTARKPRNSKGRHIGAASMRFCGLRAGHPDCINPCSMSIQLFKPYVSDEAIAAVEAVLRSGWIGLGPKTAEFESRFAEFVGARYAVGVNSATSALHLATIVSGISEGDEVLTTALTFVSTNHVILYQK